MFLVLVVEVLDLKISYFQPMGKYSVREVAEDEGEFSGDGMKTYDGEIGKYRILVEFGDADLGDSARWKMNDNGIINFANDIRAKVAHPSDHGFVLYLGSDMPMHVEAIDGGIMNSFGGTIKIPISLGG